jgi:hypothetical protein
MAGQKTGGLKKRRRTPQESSAQRARSFANKQKRRKIHAKRYPNDIAYLNNVKRWTPESQKVQRTSVVSLGGKNE